MKVAGKVLTIRNRKPRVQQIKLYAEISTPDCSAPYFIMIGGKKATSTCIICPFVFKGNRKQTRRSRLIHLDMKHPEIMENIEKTMMEELIAQKNSKIPLQISQNDFVEINKASSNGDQEGRSANDMNLPPIPSLVNASFSYGEVLNPPIKIEGSEEDVLPLSSLRPLLPNDEPNSTFTFIKRQDRSQCQLCGKFVKGEESINRKMHFNWEHKKQRDHLQRLNGIIYAEKVQSKTRIQEINNILSRDGENEWKELGILQNNLKSEDSSCEVDSEEEKESEDIFSIKRAKRTSKNKGYGLT